MSRVPWAFAALVFLPGCLGGAVIERSYFSLAYPSDAEPSASRRHDATILVRQFSCEAAYDKYELVYRESPYTFGYYRYKLWATKPRNMLQQLVTNHFRDSAIAADVVDRFVDESPTYELEGEVIAIEEINRSETEWLARLAMRITLYPYGERRPLWVWEFDEQRPVPERSPLLVVKSMSEILEAQLNLGLADLDLRLAALEAGAPVTPRPKRPKTPKAQTSPVAPPAPTEPEVKRVR